ncbi:MAG: DUF898 family protein [Pseudolabrys sp.]|nr:DUF898 family protein [Pseudolabrys sp.]MCW5686423.1 DUF898 family protein [Pseudolabrys sp.]
MTSPPAPAAPPFPIRFTGDARAYWRLLTRGALLLMVTLGIYRFWLTTDVRRFLWSSTEVNGESIEYSGTAAELLIGFLIALALLVPVYAAFFLAALDVGAFGQMSGSLGIALLFVLGQYAVFRARRYRASRTIYRGLRFHQEGSAVRYAICATIWWSLTALTLGLAFPWKESRLERFKMRHTFYGTLPGRFDGYGFSLFLRGLPLWLLVALPLAAGLTALGQSFDPDVLSRAFAESSDDFLERIAHDNPDFAGAIVFALLSAGVTLVLGLLLYPAFQAIRARWWVSGLRIGAITARSHLRTLPMYGLYLRFAGLALLFLLALGLAAIPLVMIYGALLGNGDVSILREFAASLIGLGFYVVAMLGLSTLYRGAVVMPQWRLTVESTELAGLAGLDHVEAAGEPGSPVGEGLADALHVGGI